MIILFLSKGKTQTVISVNLELDSERDYETHLYNDNGHTEAYSVSQNIEDCMRQHRLLCEKCSINTNM